LRQLLNNSKDLQKCQYDFLKFVKKLHRILQLIHKALYSFFFVDAFVVLHLIHDNFVNHLHA